MLLRDIVFLFRHKLYFKEKIMKKLSLLSALCLMLSACEMELDIPVKISELLSTETQNVTGTIAVEVSACASYEDSRIPSESLTEVRTKIKGIIPSAEYVQCYTKEMNSYAEFNIKINVKHDVETASDGISLLSDGTGALGIHIPNDVTEQIKQALYGSSDVSISFRITNDTDKQTKYVVGASYLNNQPFPLGNTFILLPNHSLDIRLSDVAKDYILQGDNFIILIPDNDDEQQASESSEQAE